MRTETAAGAAISDGGGPPPASELETALGASQRASRRRGVLIVAATALIVSGLSLAYFYHRGMTNLYLDGIAHVNIARKVVDSSEHSLWRQYLQIGSPWLPVHTVLMLPLVANDFMWRSGLAGSLISMAAFVVAAVAMYLLAWNLYATGEKGSRFLPFITAGIFIFNPAALYMQATPMTESLFMAVLALGVLLLYQWSRNQTPARLIAAALILLVATLTRYEAWPVAALSVVMVAIYSLGATPKLNTAAICSDLPSGETPANAALDSLSSADMKRDHIYKYSVAKSIENSLLYSAIVAIGPLYWLWHNWAIFGNPFEFLTGPYSARGLFSQNRATLGWANIFVGHPFLDFMLMLIAVAVCVGPLVILLSMAGLARLIAGRRAGILREAMLGLLAVPFIFHVVSLYRGEIQVFPISAFGLLNVRYGLPALVPVALFVPGIISLHKIRNLRFQALSVLAVIAIQYCWLLSSGPSGLDVYQEAYRNGLNSNSAHELSRASAYLSEIQVQPMVLMHTGALGPLVSRGGLKFSDVIHEGNARWHAFSHHIPDEVSTLIVQDADLLDVRVHSDPDLQRDLTQKFNEAYHQGRIHIYRRSTP
jgi:hypothetical protein